MLPFEPFAVQIGNDKILGCKKSFVKARGSDEHPILIELHRYIAIASCDKILFVEATAD